MLIKQPSTISRSLVITDLKLIFPPIRVAYLTQLNCAYLILHFAIPSGKISQNILAHIFHIPI